MGELRPLTEQLRAGAPFDRACRIDTAEEEVDDEDALDAWRVIESAAADRIEELQRENQKLIGELAYAAKTAARCAGFLDSNDNWYGVTNTLNEIASRARAALASVGEE